MPRCHCPDHLGNAVRFAIKQNQVGVSGQESIHKNDYMHNISEVSFALWRPIDADTCKPYLCLGSS